MKEGLQVTQTTHRSMVVGVFHEREDGGIPESPWTDAHDSIREIWGT
jgi:hypothetical protein